MQFGGCVQLHHRGALQNGTMDDGMGSAQTASSEAQQSSVGGALVAMLDAFVEAQAGSSFGDAQVREWREKDGGWEESAQQPAERQSVSERVQRFEKAAGDEPGDLPGVGALVSGVLDSLVQMSHQRLREHEQQQERERRLLLDKERRLFYPNDIQFSAARTHR